MKTNPLVKILKFVPLYFWLIAAVLLFFVEPPSGLLCVAGFNFHDTYYSVDCGFLIGFVAVLFVIAGFVWWGSTGILRKRRVKQTLKNNA